MKRLGYISPILPVRTFDPTKVTIAPTTPAPAPKPSLLDRILNTAGKVTTFANQGVATYNNITNAVSPSRPNTNAGAPQQDPFNYSYTAPGSASGKGSNAPGMSTGTKVAIGVGVAVLVGTVVYFASGKKK